LAAGSVWTVGNRATQAREQAVAKRTERNTAESRGRSRQRL